MVVGGDGGGDEAMAVRRAEGERGGLTSCQTRGLRLGTSPAYRRRWITGRRVRDDLIDFDSTMMEVRDDLSHRLMRLTHKMAGFPAATSQSQSLSMARRAPRRSNCLLSLACPCLPLEGNTHACAETAPDCCWRPWWRAVGSRVPEEAALRRTWGP